jgi:hypothetical protein
MRATFPPTDRPERQGPSSGLTILHPEPVAAAALAHALKRHQAAAGLRVGHRLDLPMTTRSAEEIVVVRVSVLDRLTGGWPGERYLHRVTSQPDGPRAIAWIDADDRDALAVAAAAGVPVLRTKVGPELALAVQIDAAAAPPAPTPAEVAEFEAWFAATYPGAQWAPDVEHVLAVLVSGGAAKERAAWLGLALNTEGSRATMARLRTVSEWLVGEIRDDDLAVRAEAMIVLRRLARIRPLAADIMHSRSLSRAVALLDAAPGIVDAAGLDDSTVALLRGVRDHLPCARTGRRGRLPAGAWRRHRILALTTLACAREERGPARAALRDDYERRLANALDDLYAALYSAARCTAAR